MQSKRFLKSELRNIYKRIDIEKFLSHYNVKITGRFGNELRMHCILPNHKDTSPSGNFNISKGFYNCFVCGGRNFFQLVQELENLSTFKEAVEFVMKQVGFDNDDEINKIDALFDELRDLQEENDAEEQEPEFIEIKFKEHPEFESAFKHFSKVKKRVTKEMIDIWNLRYAVGGYYKDRLVIPITHNKKTMSFAARDMSGRSEIWLKMLKTARKDRLTVTEVAELQNKYECKKIIYPPVFDKFNPEHEFSSIIFGSAIKHLMFNFDNAIASGKDYVILVEGAFDAMRLFTWGFNAVAILGTKLSTYNRSRLLSNFDVIYVCLDNDVKDDKSNPGQDAAKSIVESLEGDIDVFNIVLPPGKDPDECEKDEFEHCLEVSRISSIIW